MSEVVFTFDGRELVDERSDGLPECVDGSGLSSPEKAFELGECQFDRVEVRAVGRQEEKSGTASLDCGLNPVDFVAAKIVEYDDVAVAQLRCQNLFDIGAEDRPVHGAIDHEGRDNPVRSKTGHEGAGFPVPVRSRAVCAFAARSTSVTARHVGRRPCFVDEDQLLWPHGGLQIMPNAPFRRYVGSFLLGGAERLFLSVRPSRCNVFHMPPVLDATPCVVNNQRRRSSRL